jgi:hypothetical protein
MLSFAIPYGILASFVARLVAGRAPIAEGLLIALTVTLIASLILSAGGVLAGEWWAFNAESLWIGNGHISYRAERIPWVHHRVAIFTAGIAIFWAIAAARYRLDTTARPG